MSVVSTSKAKPPIYYPESDGLPMSDNTVQFRWLMTLQGGLDALFDAPGLDLVAVSPVYQTAPVGGPQQSLRCQRGQRFSGERMHHPAALDDLVKFHPSSVGPHAGGS